MIEIAFLFIVLFASIFLEVCCGALGWLIPLTALSVFHLSIVYGWRSGMLVGVLAGAVIDSLYGRMALTTPFSMAAIALFSVFWLRKGDPTSIFPNFLPGAVAGALAALPPLLLNSWWHRTLFVNIDVLFLSSVSGAVILPVLITFLDIVSEKTGLRLYRKAKAAAKAGML
ncbi:MAG: hypothetical protein KAG97_11330 [Victivallales bacterium]|nr:hypothetical protein [Victivallales bacterium]